MFACEFVTTFATLRQAATVATACGRRSHSNGGGRRSKCQCDANGRSKVKKSARDSQNVDFWHFWDFLARASHLGTAVPGDSPES